MSLTGAILDLIQYFLCRGGKKNQGDQPGGPQQQQYPPHPQPQQQQYPPQGHRPQQQQQYHPQQQQQQRPAAGKKPLQQRYDDNAVNQQNPQYKSLRARAHEEGDNMARCFRESKEAYSSGDGARAKQLSNEGKQHQSEMERLNREASEWIFRENNLDSAPDELDLHGLYVKEAIEKTDQAIVAAQGRGDDHIRIITGKGLHSQGSVAKLKPAIEDLMTKHRLTASLDPDNAGVLVVSLTQQGRSRGMGSDEITNRIQNNECIIM